MMIIPSVKFRLDLNCQTILPIDFFLDVNLTFFFFKTRNSAFKLGLIEGKFFLKCKNNLSLTKFRREENLDKCIEGTV